MADLDYRAYLATREWAVRKKAVRERSRGLCERCVVSVPMHAVHHLTYEHIGNEPLEDLQAVCKPCHEYLSARSDFDPLAVALDGVAARLLIEAGLSVEWIKGQVTTLHKDYTAQGEKVESLIQLVPALLYAGRQAGLVA